LLFFEAVVFFAGTKDKNLPKQMKNMRLKNFGDAEAEYRISNSKF
jgi:hypothetical protein